MRLCIEMEELFPYLEKFFTREGSLDEFKSYHIAELGRCNSGLKFLIKNNCLLPESGIVSMFEQIGVYDENDMAICIIQFFYIYLHLDKQ